MKKMSNFGKVVEAAVKLVVKNPAAVSVKEVTGAKTVIIKLEVAPEDVGAVIGKKGKTIKAIQSILFAGGRRERKRVIFEFNPPKKEKKAE